MTLRRRVGDDRGIAASIILLPVFFAVVFMFVQGVFWQNSRQIASQAADRASQAVAMYGSSVGDAETNARTQMTSAGLDDVAVSVSRGDSATVVEVSGVADGLLPGMTITVTARSVTPTEDWQD